MPDSAVAAIARRLETTRNALGLSQAQLCRHAGIAANTYSQYESGNGRPSLDYAMRLCQTFGLTLDWIYFGNAAGLPDDLAARIAEQEATPRPVIGKVGRPTKARAALAGGKLVVPLRRTR